MVRRRCFAGNAALVAALVLAGLTAGLGCAAQPVYTRDNAPATPKPEDLELKNSVAQYGITWTFEKPARVGQFVNGDYYVVGPVTIAAIDPPVLLGEQVPEEERGAKEMRKRAADKAYVRNGSMLNPPAKREVAYDSGIYNWFRPNLVAAPPIKMAPGDSLVSTISIKKGVRVPKLFRGDGNREYTERENGDDSPVQFAAVLTCVREPQPPDAFRPSYCDRTQRIYLARNLRRDLLPGLKPPTGDVIQIHMLKTDMDYWIRIFQRPWVNTGFFGFEEPMQNMPFYGREVARAVGTGALILCCDLPAEKKEQFLINYVQVGIDYWGVVRAGHPGWMAFGGHGSGRKLPIVLAGHLLGDKEMASPTRAFPKVEFQEDTQVMYDTCWTGAFVVYSGHRGTPDGKRVTKGQAAYHSYEHLPPAEWKSMTGEGYRRCCTSTAWVGEALAIRLLHLEDAWNQPAFLDYADRWMYEDDTESVKIVNAAKDRKYEASQGESWEPFVNRMWAMYRTAPGMPPTDGWKKPRPPAVREGEPAE